MRTKLFLTSCIALGFTCPAMAEEFPSNGLMTENKTYTNAATSTNMDGVYEGTVDAVAEYENILYQIVAGQYLPASSETPIDCNQNGYYCPGDQNGVYYSSSAQGLSQCPTGYDNTATGASSENECYRQCNGNVTIEHATGVTGLDYYGNGVDTCEPTGCMVGWQIRGDENLLSAIGEDSATAVSGAYINSEGVFNESSASYGQSFYGINSPNTWAVYYGPNKGMITGTARCSETPGTANWDGSNSTFSTVSTISNESGNYCWCHIDNYTLDGETWQSVNSPWMISEGCSYNYCVYHCHGYMRYYTQNPFRMIALNEATISSGSGAICEAKEYAVTSGKYLPSSSETLTQCPAGSYCPGLQNTVNYSTTNNQGLNACPTGYTNSVAGASANTDCFRTCTNNDVAHSTGTVNGGVYYNGTSGDGVVDCTPTGCENGWHVKAAVTAPNLTSLIGSGWGRKSVYKSTSGTGRNSGAEDLSAYGITQNGEFVVDYGNKGKIHGHAQCSTQSGTRGTVSNGTYPDITTITTLPDSSGRYCYCRLDGYTTAGGDTTALSTPWVFFNDNVGADACAHECANLCSGNLQDDDSDVLVFRAAVFGAIESSPAMCEANTITINWNGTTQAAIDANNAGTATYGSDVRTPQSASHVPGKTFTGWRFSKPEQTNLPD